MSHPRVLRERTLLAYAILARRASAAAGHAHVTKRILLVNEVGAAADSLALALRRMGQDAYTASGYREARAVAREVQPEAVLLDLAWERRRRWLAQRLREQLGPSALIIAAVGNRQRRAPVDPIDHHVSRPIDMRILRSLMGDPPVRAAGS